MDKTQMYAGVEVYMKPLGANHRGRPRKMVRLPSGVCMGYAKFEASFRKARKAEKKAAKKVGKTAQTVATVAAVEEAAPVAPVAVETPAVTTPTTDLPPQA